MKLARKHDALTWYALAFGFFLGLTILKFGNPVILDEKIIPPSSFYELLTSFWPTHWAIWIFIPFAIIGMFFIRHNKLAWPGNFWLLLLPLLWLGWQFISSVDSVDHELSASTLLQFSGCVAAYLIGAWALGRPERTRWLLFAVLAAFTFCLMRAVDQRLYEFPDSYQSLTEGQRNQWTNFPTSIFLELKHDGVIVNTNGMDVANPAILAKFAKGRVNGTLVYPNALAGVILLLLPASLAIAFNDTLRFRPMIRWSVILLTAGLGAASFFFSGSKLGWLLAIGLVGLMLFRLDWSIRLKWLALVVVLVAGLGVFAIRFHNYLAAGATSAGARFDYWRAAVQTTRDYPLLGTGPGTFQKPYSRLKSPDAEMARLTHNDYLEQFSDSGLVGGLIYAAWITLALVTAGRQLWQGADSLSVALVGGVLAWFVQGFGEFGLYIPGLAWPAFTLLGCIIGLAANEFDKKTVI